MSSSINPSRRVAGVLASLIFLLFAGSAWAQQPTQALTVPLLLPGGLAFDAAGNLFFAETQNHVVRRMTPAGVLTTVAGNGTQGFGGDSGPATAALLDSPLSVALDSLGNLYLADAHNHRIRRVDALTGSITTYAGSGVAGSSPDGTAAVSATIDLPSALAVDAAGNLFFADARTHRIRRIDLLSGLISTVAGNGTQGFSGDGGPALAAEIDTPAGLAVDAAGNVYLSDSHNHRVRRVDATSRVITTVSGSGRAGFAGDQADASSAALDLPRGLAVDASGTLFIVDSRNQRIRRVDATTNQITTIAGQGTQAFAGDGSAANAAALDSPRGVAVSPAGLATFSDSANQRIRQVNSAAIIHTLGGLGGSSQQTLLLTAPAVTRYGTGSVTATLNASTATGSVTFFDTQAGVMRALSSQPLAGNTATLSLAPIPAGTHRVTATYGGDASHGSAQSTAVGITISPAPAFAAPDSFSLVYGQPVPMLKGTLSGVLPADASTTSLGLTTLATALSVPAVYPVTASLAGAGAGNYTLTQSSASVSIAQAPSSITLSNALAVHVGSIIAGTPSGSVDLYDAGSRSASATLSAAGDAQFSASALSTGTHTLTAIYTGDPDFLPVTSSPQIATIGAGAAADFSLAATGSTSGSTSSGGSVAFSFTVTPLNGGLSSPIQLTVAGLPTGATASFSPAYLPPRGTPAVFTLTIQTVKTAGLRVRDVLVFALLIPAGLLLRRRRRLVLLGALLTASVGCGDRVTVASTANASATYNLTVAATGTSLAGATVQHTVGILLTVQH